MTSINYSPLEGFQLALRRWWLIAIFLLIGGLLGWGFSRMHTPVYDAQALLVITIDYQQAPELTQKTDDHYTEDQILGAASAVVISSEVLDQVGAELQANGVSVNWETYVRNLSIERKRSQFWLRVRDTDPQRAAQVANLWIEQAYAALVADQQHAARAKVLRDYLDGIASCQPVSKPSNPPGTAYPPPGGQNALETPTPPDMLYLPQVQYTLPPTLCDDSSQAEIQQAITAATTQMDIETSAANALSPALTFSLSRKAPTPATPVAYRTSLLVTVGALLGGAVSLVVLPLTDRTRLGKRSDRQTS